MTWTLAAILACAFTSSIADFVTTRQDTGEEITVKTRTDPLTYYSVAETPVEHELYDDVVVESFESHDLELMTGEAWFTLPDVNKLPMPVPGVPYALLGAKYDIVHSDTGTSAPLSEMYSHHWLVYDKLIGSSGFNIGCGGDNTFVSNVFGAGGEMRGITYDYPPGYGKVYPGTKQTYWSANMHFIRTEDLSTERYNGSYGQALKSCIECDYEPGRAASCVPGLDQTAIFGCCFDGSRCTVNNPSDKSKKKYKLVYNITYTKQVSKVKEVGTYVIDAFNCNICENLYANHKTAWTTCDDKTCVTTGTRTMPVSGTIVWAYTHQHTGAMSSTMSVNGVPHCTSYPHYGTDPQNHPGNEKGYAVGFHMCINPLNTSQAIHVNKGDNITITARISVDPEDKTSLPIPGGDRHGFMNLFYFVVHPEDKAETYACVSNKCVQKDGGVPLSTCQAACGGTKFV